jgi:NifU-like protein involved in Fe-S cluster formation
LNAPLYTLEVLRLAAALPEPKTLERVDGAAELRSPTCGSVVHSEVQLKGGRIEALSQQVQACAFGQASAALVANNVVGRSRDEISEVLEQLSKWLAREGDEPGWPDIAALAPARSRTSRHGAILLPFRTLLAAIEAAG